jgi:NF-kappa-B inhibitor-like protein 2
LGRVYLLQGQTEDNNSKAFRLAEKSFIQSLQLCHQYVVRIPTNANHQDYIQILLHSRLKGQIAKSEFSDMQARLYLNIGVIKENVADYAESMRHYDKAIQMCQANDLYDLLHQCYTTAALLYSGKLNDTAKSLKMLNSALEVAKRLSNNSLKMCETLNLKADVLIKLGDFQSAKQVLHKAYKIRTPDPDDRAKIERTLKIVAAICYTEDSLITADSEDYKGKKTLYEKMGDGACKLENYAIGAVYYSKMLKNAKLNGETEKALIPCYISLYQTYIDNKEYEKALEFLEEELRLIENEPTEAFNTLINIGGVYESMAKGFWETERVYQRARKEAQKLNDEKLERIALKKLVDLHVKNDYGDLADTLKREAKSAGIDMDVVLPEEEEGDANDESSDSNDLGDTPDIGDEICLEDLSGKELFFSL